MFLMVTGFMNYGHQTILAARYIGQGFMITLSHANRLPVTIQYPYEKLITSEHFCGRIHFEFDECIACEVCVRVCPINLPIVGWKFETDIRKNDCLITVLISEFVYFVVTALSIVQQFFYQFLSLQN
ncbi:hypothetical protein ES332_A11G202900v1, partial [Gossypium tomentosum]